MASKRGSLKKLLTMLALVHGAAVTLESDALLVTLDSMLPRPASIFYKTAGVDFSPSTSAAFVNSTGLPDSRACISLVATGGASTRFCASAGEVKVAYSKTTAQKTEWTATLSKSADGAQAFTSAQLSGLVSVDSSNIEWDLLTCNSSATVRAVDLEFAFASLAGSDTHVMFTSADKNWCAPGTACQEWQVREQSHSSSSIISKSSIVTTDLEAKLQWAPPSPLPWAHQALIVPGRSATVGAWYGNGSAGVAVKSSQRTVPVQAFQQQDSQTIGVGSARMNVNLRCGNVLPVQLKFGIFSDITADGTVNGDDVKVWIREQYPLAHYVFRSGITWKLDTDISSYNGGTKNRIRFNETLDYIKTLANITDYGLNVVHLVGWQGTGHDTLYPSLDQINPLGGSAAELLALFKTAKEKYNTIISYHINTDEAYMNYTAVDPSGDPAINHPVPNTKDGQHNPDFDTAIISLQPNGTLWPWAQNANQRPDPFLGPAYHISKTKDAATGKRMQRLDKFVKTVPLEHVIHSDAYRDIDTSWESDEAGYIAEDEEMACGCAGVDGVWLAKNNLSLGVEATNGMLSAGGNTAPTMGLIEFYWDGSNSIGDWGRIVMGSTANSNHDIQWGEFNDPNNWHKRADSVYRQAKVYSMQMTASLLSLEAGKQFSGGGNDTHWPYAGGMIRYVQGQNPGDAVFIPKVIAPPFGSSKEAVAQLDQNTVYVYSKYCFQKNCPPVGHEWILPPKWHGLVLSVRIIAPPDSTPALPELEVNGTRLRFWAVPGVPYVLTAKVPEPPQHQN